MKQLEFANRIWNVRDEGYIAKGPGPNYWSEDNVWVDLYGHLHLTVQWNPLYACYECAQVELDESLGYGKYRWKVEGFHDRMDEQIILGLYTYDQLAYSANYREIDIEHGRWGDPAKVSSQNVVMPSDPQEGYKSRYETTQSGSYTTHEFEWGSNSIHFKSWYGHIPERTPYHEWIYNKSDVPDPGSATARMNLWLFQGKPPSNGRDQEIVIRDFEFFPYQ